MFKVICLLLPLFAFSGINLKNGNFYISYTDIMSSLNGKTLEMTRTYNSKSTHVGWFGYGWGTPYETRLEAQVDGSVIIVENGSGGKSRFAPRQGISKQRVEKAVKRIIAKLGRMTGKSRADVYKKMMTDSDYRSKMAKKVGVKIVPKSGTVMQSFDFGNQNLEVVDKGYKRSFDTGLKQYFSKNGDLIASVDKSGYRVKFERDKATRRVKKIFDSLGNQMSLTWDSNGLIVGIKSTGRGSASYSYKGKNLIASKDINAKKYTYAYDSFHNLVKIKDLGVKDKTKSTMTVTYQAKTFFATSLRKRSGEIIKYTYGSNPKKSSLHYWTTVEKSGINNIKYANYYEYEHKKRSDGSSWLYRTKFQTTGDLKNGKVIGGVTRETIHNECCEMPIKIIQGNQVTEFKYKNGLMVSKKSSDGSYSRLDYDSRTKKVAKVTNNNGWTKYIYNKRGDLKTAKDSKGIIISLIYDLKGKITKMVHVNKEKKKDIISFKYNAQGKPNDISMSGVGKIMVGYDSFGQVKKVDSSGGRQVASQVTGAFRNLLEIVQPAGVNLNI